MDISVVIPTKDRLKFLKKAIQMYLAYPEVKEIIVVIDGSTDGTYEYLVALCNKEERLKYINNGVNKGLPYSRNVGIQAAVHSYIFSSEDDLEVTNDFFRTLVSHLMKSGGDIICGRNIFRYENESLPEALNRTDKLTGEYVNKKTVDIVTGMHLADDEKHYMIASPMLAKAEVFKSVVFDIRYRVNFWREETDFQLSAQEMGYTLVSCPHAVSYNIVIENDRSGAHAAVGIKRVKWVIINNWIFITKHRAFLRQHFEIGNPYIYITRFAITRILNEIVIPRLIFVKQTALKRHK